MPGLGEAHVRIQDQERMQKMIVLLTEADARRILPLTVDKAKSVSDMSQELNLPARSVYRYTEQLCSLGLLAPERNVLIDTGGKYSLFRSMVRTVAMTYDVESNSFDVDLTPNQNILDKFLRFWSYMGR